MNSKIEISKFDIRVSQVMTWVFTLLFLIISVTIIFYSFTIDGFYIVFFLLFVVTIINYAGAKVWNIWCENDFLIIQNIYSTRKVSINQFKEIKMTSIFNNSYTLYLNDGKKYLFRIKQTNDLILFLKSDPQYYAKQMTKQLIEIKQKL